MSYNIARRAALLGLALFAAACSGDSAPTAIAPVDPSLKKGPKEPTTVVSPELLAEEQAELVRVRIAADESGAALDSLKGLWKAGRKELKKGSPVLVCEPLKYDAEVRIVGPEGGELRAGPHRLVIPAGALSQPTVITAEATVSLARELRFSPHGTQFAVAPMVVMSYRGCAIPADFDNSLAYIDESLDVLEWPEAKDGKKGEVISYIWHFSRYALANRSTYATSW